MQLFHRNVHRLHSSGLLHYYLAPIGLVYFADAILAYTFPILLEKSLQSPALVGMIMALSSVVGITWDLIFPRLLRNMTWYRILFIATCTATTFTLSVYASTIGYPVLFGILAVAIWGTYYELIGFSQDRFVVHNISRARYMRTWALIGIASLFAIIAGPLVGQALLQSGTLVHTIVIICVQALAIFLALRTVRRMRRRHADSYPQYEHHVSRASSLFASFYYWRYLARPLLPIILSIFVFRAIEASYWMFGALYAREMNGVFVDREWLLLLIFTAPFVIAALTVSRASFPFAKRRTAHLALLCGGALMLAAHQFEHTPSLFITLLLLANTCIAFIPFMTSTVSSGVQEFLPEQFRPYVTGLIGMTSSLAYIVAPFVGGAIAEAFGYSSLFSMWAIIALVFGIVLITLSPPHIRVPVSKLKSVRL